MKPKTTQEQNVDQGLDARIDLPPEAAAVVSPLQVPEGLEFSDDREGMEARMLIAGYAEYLAYIVKSHYPVRDVRVIVSRINEVVAKATYREITKVITKGERPN